MGQTAIGYRGIVALATVFPSWGRVRAEDTRIPAAQRISAARFFRGRMPWRRWPMLVYTVLVTPLHAALTRFAGNEIEWRGQRVRVYRDAHFDRVA